MSYNLGLLSSNNELLWGRVACHFRLPGVPGSSSLTNQGPTQSLCYPLMAWDDRLLWKDVAKLEARNQHFLAAAHIETGLAVICLQSA